jgi:hypothetical protein
MCLLQKMISNVFFEVKMARKTISWKFKLFLKLVKDNKMKIDKLVIQ